jgi:hypothetical protein
MGGSVAMRPSVSVQTTLRLAAGLALNLGTSSANMLPLPVTTANGDLSVGLPSNMDRLNVNVGLHWMLYEKSYRDQAKARRAAKKAKRSNRGGTTAPAPAESPRVVPTDSAPKRRRKDAQIK